MTSSHILIRLGTVATQIYITRHDGLSSLECALDSTSAAPQVEGGPFRSRAQYDASRCNFNLNLLRYPRKLPCLLHSITSWPPGPERVQGFPCGSGKLGLDFDEAAPLLPQTALTLSSIIAVQAGLHPGKVCHHGSMYLAVRRSHCSLAVVFAS